MTYEESNKIEIVKKRIRLASIPAIVLLSVVWLLFLVNQTLFSYQDLMHLGIVPNTVRGLRGIFFAPLLHTSFSHLWSNTVSLFVLTWFLFYFYSKIAPKVLLSLWLISGVVTWLIGRSALHVGASGLIFGILFFLFFSGIFRKYTPLVAVSLIVAFIYGGSVWSIFPITEWIDASISWEGHLSGALSGLIMSLILRKQGPQKPEIVWDEDEDEEHDACAAEKLTNEGAEADEESEYRD